MNWEQERIAEIFEHRPGWADGYRERVFKDSKGICGLCAQVIAGAFDVDHQVSWETIKQVAINDPDLWELPNEDIKFAAAYLYHYRDNLVAAHKKCNGSKGKHDSDVDQRLNDNDQITTLAAESSRRKAHFWESRKP